MGNGDQKSQLLPRVHCGNCGEVRKGKGGHLRKTGADGRVRERRGKMQEVHM